MLVTIHNEVPFQILSSSFSIGPSQTGYELQVGADSKTFSTLFSVGANTPRMVTNVANGSYFRLKNNVGDVKVNWQRVCVDEGGGSGTELQPVADFPLNAVEGTVISYTGSSSASGVYQYDGNEWTAVGADDLSAYWTSAETQSAITAVEDHLFDVEEVTASALTELHDDVLELSARTVDLSAYTPTANFATINGSAITNGGNIVIEGGGDMSDYWTSAQTQTAISAATQDMVTSTSVSTIWKGTQAEYDAITTKDPNTFYIIL